MWNLVRIVPAAVLALAVMSYAVAQQPPAKPAEEPTKDKKKDYSDSPIVTKMMAFNKKNDGKLTKDEVTDPRLHRLFDQADANKDGVVTKEELMALAAKLEADVGPGGPGGPGGRGPGGGGPGGPGGGPGGRGPGGPPLGQVMPEFVQDNLKLTNDQKKQLADLQKELDAKLDKILTDDQKKQYKEMKDNPGRGGPGGPGGRGPVGPGGRGPGGPGGGPGGGPPGEGRP
jgi:EF hand